MAIRAIQKEKIIHINNNQQKMLKFDTERRGHFAKKYAFIIIEKRKEKSQ